MMNKEDKIKKAKTDKVVGEVKIPAQEYQELTELSQKSQEHFDKLLRLHAEFENFKKRNQKQREQFLKFANEGLIRELVGILDNFELAFESANKMDDFKSLHQGVEMILKQIHKLLEKNGVKKIECVGKPYDPAQQEAIGQVETDQYPEGTVVDEVQKGYLLEDRLLRPTVVRIAKKPKK